MSKPTLLVLTVDYEETDRIGGVLASCTSILISEDKHGLFQLTYNSASVSNFALSSHLALARTSCPGGMVVLGFSNKVDFW
jgi:hypothetical protein